MNLEAKVKTEFPVPHPWPGSPQKSLGRLLDLYKMFALLFYVLRVQVCLADIEVFNGKGMCLLF